MKKTTTLLLAVCILCMAGKSQPITEPYHFPLKPGSPGWQSFKTVDDMYQACQVPPEILQRLTTKALLLTCLNYPARTVLLAHNSPQDGFNDWKSHFNGIAELLKRGDAKDEILLLYEGFDTRGHITLKTEAEKGDYTFTLQAIEIILVQDDITGRLTPLQQRSLLKTSLQKYRNMESDGVYGFFSRASTGRIVSKLSVGLGSRTINAKTIGDAQEFIKTGLLKDRQVLFNMIQEASKINTNH